ncbi:MAG: hypothetical protein Q9217_004774 [Psora testacea]
MARTSANWHPGLSEEENMKRLRAQETKASPPSTPTRTKKSSRQEPVTPSSGLAAIKLEDTDYTPIKPRLSTKASHSSMARQRAPRPSKRHLVRWSDDLDVQLLLTIQSECNAAGIAIPWDAIGNTLGIGATGGAIIQHLAKTRSRRVAAGLQVPPPLRRGGGISRVPTGSSSRVRAVSLNQGLFTKRTHQKLRKTSKKTRSLSDDNEDDDSKGVWDSDPDDEYGKSRSKRTRKARYCAVKNEESSEDEHESPNKAGEKRKRGSRFGMRSPTPAFHGKSSTRVHHGMKVEGYASGCNDSDGDSDGEVGSRFVGAGSKFLALEDDHEVKYHTGAKTVPQRQSMVMKLSVGRRPSALAVLQRFKENPDTDVDDSDSESTSDGGHQSIKGEYEEDIPSFDPKDRQEVLEYGHHPGFSGSRLQNEGPSPQPLSFAHEDGVYSYNHEIGGHRVCRPGNNQTRPRFGSFHPCTDVFDAEYDSHNASEQQQHAFHAHFGASIHHSLVASQHVGSDCFQGWGGHVPHDGGYGSLPRVETSRDFGGMDFGTSFISGVDSTPISSVSPKALHHSPVGKPPVRPSLSINMSSGPSTSLPTPGPGLSEQGDVFAGPDFDEYMHDQ